MSDEHKTGREDDPPATRSHPTSAYVGVATEPTVPSEDGMEPSLQEAIHKAAALAAADTAAGNLDKLFDVRIQIVVKNPHIKEVRATITRSDTYT